uniref:Uncharacterized protein n=1 Tax=Micrurus corallinus TaxID=54390 RepID=A0A2D4FLU1_MICCO
MRVSLLKEDTTVPLHAQQSREGGASVKRHRLTTRMLLGGRFHPAPDDPGFLKPSFPGRGRVRWVGAPEVEMMGAPFDGDGSHGGAQVLPHTAGCPGVQVSIGKDNVACSSQVAAPEVDAQPRGPGPNPPLAEAVVFPGGLGEGQLRKHVGHVVAAES